MKTNYFFSGKMNQLFIAFFFLSLISIFSVQAINVKGTFIDRVGVWPDVGGTATNSIGDYVEVTFDGTGIIWEAVKWDNAGMVEITLDGQVIEKLDMFGGIWERVNWEKTDLEAGYHVLRITLIEEKNPDSPDHWINLFGRFVVIDPLITEEGEGWTSKREGWGGYGLPSNCIPDDYIEVPFQGTGVKFNYLQFKNGGMAQASIDGADVETIDFYGDDNTDASWQKDGLSDGKHVLRITISDQHNPEAIPLDPENPEYYINHISFETIGTTITESGIDWDLNPFNNSVMTSVRSATLDVTFEGNSIRWISKGELDAGIATVSIDGGAPEKVNQQRESENIPIIWEKTGLTGGTHNLRIAMSEDSPADSYINYVSFEQVGRAGLPSSIFDFSVSDADFKIQGSKLLVLNDKFTGQELQVYVYSFSGKAICCYNELIGSNQQEIELPGLYEPAIIVVMNNNKKVFSQKYWQD